MKHDQTKPKKAKGSQPIQTPVQYTNKEKGREDPAPKKERQIIIPREGVDSRKE